METIYLDNLNDLAKRIEVDVADIYEHVRVPIDTSEGRREVTIGEWKDGWRANEEAAQAREQALVLRAQYEREREDSQTRYQHALAQAGALADQMSEVMLAPFQQIDWPTLRETNPAEWTAKMEELRQTQTAIERNRAAVQEKIQGFSQELSAQQQRQLEEHVKRERDALYRMLPEWAEPEQAKTHVDNLRNYLTSQGFTGDEVEQTYDHRLIVLAEKARLYDESLKGVAVAKKKIAKVAKRTISPGAKPNRGAALADQSAAVRKRLRSSGSVDDAAAAIGLLYRRE